MKEFIEVIKNRKSVRSFKKERVSQELINNLISLATYAPTSCNQQLWNFIIIDKEDIKERLIKKAYANTLIRRAPVIIVITYDGWNYKEGVQGVSMATENILLAVTHYGLGACPMNSYGAEAKVKEILNIPGNELIGCFILLGYPDNKANKASLVPRRPISEIMHWNKFNNKKKPSFTYYPNDWDLDDLKQHQKYYCRKTVLGKEMDIMSQGERDIVQFSLLHASEPLIDLFSYDGSYLREFPKILITSFDLTPETSDYTKAAVELLNEERADKISYGIYNAKSNKLSSDSINTVTLIYKLERLSDKLKEKIFSQIYNTLDKEGQLIIVARKSNIFLKIFYMAVKLFLGKDIRKTGIYNFFGPYQPINLLKTIWQLKKAGFSKIKWSGYFFIPVFYEQIYQMIIQYVKSGGSSYLNREIRRDFISKALRLIMKIQEGRKVGRWGSVTVIICQK